jgi:hypothetical protein
VKKSYFHENIQVTSGAGAEAQDKILVRRTEGVSRGFPAGFPRAGARPIPCSGE